MSNTYKLNCPTIENFTGVRPGALHYGNISLLRQLPANSVVMVADSILPLKKEEVEITVRIVSNLGHRVVLESEKPLILKLFLVLAKSIKLHHTNKSTTLRSSEYELSVLDHCYPVLMCADVLYFNPKNIYVGYDQTTHVEFYNDVCSRLNIKNTTNWKIYENKNNIMDLKDPMKKMSKSSIDQNGVICVTDREVDIVRKIKASPTSSYNVNIERNKHTDNLMAIYAVANIDEDMNINDVYTKYHDMRWSDFKEILTSRIIKTNNYLLTKVYSITDSVNFDDEVLNLIGYLMDIK